MGSAWAAAERTRLCGSGATNSGSGMCVILAGLYYGHFSLFIIHFRIELDDGSAARLDKELIGYKTLAYNRLYLLTAQCSGCF